MPPTVNDVEDQSRKPSLLLLLRAAIQRRDRETHTGMPAEVQAYDPTKQTVDVQPLLMFLVPDEAGNLVAETLPVLSSIPVHFPGGGGMRATFPLVLGDTGWVKFAEGSLDAWQAKGGLTNPGDQRRFSIADAVFEPGLHANDKPWKHANSTDASFGNDDGPQLVVTPAGYELGGHSDDRPTEAIVLGTTYRQNEDTWFAAISSRLQALGASLSTAGASFTTAAGDAGFSGPAPTAAAAVGVAGTTLVAAAVAIEQIAADLASFNAQAAKYLSTIGKSK